MKIGIAFSNHRSMQPYSRAGVLRPNTRGTSMSAVFTRDPDAETRADIIRSTADALKDAWNKHDAKAFTDAFTDDAEFTNVFGMVSRGRGEIERTHAFIFAG